MKRIIFPINKTEFMLWFIVLLLVTGGVLCWLVWQYPDRLRLIRGTPEQGRWLTGLVVGTLVLAVCALVSFAAIRLTSRRHFYALQQRSQGYDVFISEE